MQHCLPGCKFSRVQIVWWASPDSLVGLPRGPKTTLTLWGGPFTTKATPIE